MLNIGKLYSSLLIICISFVSAWDNLQTFVKCGFKPKQFLDVGANIGQYTKGYLSDFPETKGKPICCM
jgi:hypothetical protein